jgi:hypothetical protein
MTKPDKPEPRKENQKRTQRRKDAKKTQNCFFCYSLRNLCGSASLREILLFSLHRFRFCAKTLAVFSLLVLVCCAPLAAQEKAAPSVPSKAAGQDVDAIEPAISDTTRNARVFLDKVEVLGTVAKPQALFILPGNDPTVDGLTIDRSFFKEIFRPVEWGGVGKNKKRGKTRLQW